MSSGPALLVASLLVALAHCAEPAGVAWEFDVASTDTRPVAVEHGHVQDDGDLLSEERRDVDGVTDLFIYYDCGEPDSWYIRIFDRVTGEVLHTEMFEHGPCPFDRWLWDGDDLRQLPEPDAGELPEWPDDLYREE